MRTHEELIQEWMEDPEFVEEYDDLEYEFSQLADTLKQKQDEQKLQEGESTK